MGVKSVENAAAFWEQANRSAAERRPASTGPEARSAAMPTQVEAQVLDAAVRWGPPLPKLAELADLRDLPLGELLATVEALRQRGLVTVLVASDESKFLRATPAGIDALRSFQAAMAPA